MDKAYSSAAAATADIGDGVSIAVGGLGLCGIPTTLIEAVHARGARLAERLRAGGCDNSAFYTPAGVGTQIGDGGLPLRHRGPHGPALLSAPREIRSFAGVDHVLEHAIVTDFALVRAARADRHGNLVFHRSARNFNPLAAMAGRITIAEAEELVEAGELDPDEIHLPGIFVQRVIALTAQQAGDKRIEKRTVRA